MNFKKLKDRFISRSDEIKNSDSKSAKFRARYYTAVGQAIENTYELNDKVSVEKINDLPISDHMKKVALDIFNDIPLKKIKSKSKSRSKSKSKSRSKSKSKTKTNPKLINQLVTFMGLGKEKANKLVDEGLININQLHMKKWMEKLPKHTQLYLQLKPNQEIPHEDIIEIAPHLNCKMVVTIVGGYRRKIPISKDIDILISSKKEDAIEKYFKCLSKTFKVYPYSQGKDKMSFIADFTELLGKSEQVLYKIDVFRTDPENLIPMLLYSTGSKENNIIMRSKAKKKGYTLNQNGLFKKNGTSLEKVKGLDSEKDYYDFLGIEYKEPEDR